MKCAGGGQSLQDPLKATGRVAELRRKKQALAYSARACSKTLPRLGAFRIGACVVVRGEMVGGWVTFCGKSICDSEVSGSRWSLVFA